MLVPILLPELGVRDGSVRISCWLVDLGDRVEAGDRIVEVLVPGITYDVQAPAAGVLARIDKPLESIAKTGEALGWIEPEAGP
jgi:pyruvate/2-oxoglutarate dehydrogenase complex dihydrolipoamide acyltransferase (E2) component